MDKYTEWKPVTDLVLILERLNIASNEDLFTFVKAAIARLDSKIDVLLKEMKR